MAKLARSSVLTGKARDDDDFLYLEPSHYTRFVRQELEACATGSQEEGRPEQDVNHSAVFADPCFGGIGSPVGGSKEVTATGDVFVEDTVGVPSPESSFIPIGDQDSLTTMLEDTLKTEDTGELVSMLKHAPNISVVALAPQGAAPPRGVPAFRKLASQPWLYRHSTLQQTGRLIGAELEVAMLCMQKRLGKVSYQINV